MEKVKRTDIQDLFKKETKLTKYATQFVCESDDKNAEVKLVEYKKSGRFEKAILAFKGMIYIFITRNGEIDVDIMTSMEIEKLWEAVKNK